MRVLLTILSTIWTTLTLSDGLTPRLYMTIILLTFEMTLTPSQTTVMTPVWKW